MTNVVTLELTGDETSLEDAITRATQRVKDMDQAVTTSAGSIEQSSGKVDAFSEHADKLASRSGILAGGIGAIAGGMALLGVNSDSTAGKIIGGVSVAIGTLSGVMDIVAIATSSQTVAMIGQKVAMVAGAAATGIATAAQWALNIAMEANPIGLIIIAIVALIAIIVLIATKTTWFQTAWKAAWEGIKIAIGAVKDFFVNVVWHDGIEKAFNWIATGVDKVLGFFTGMPGKIGSAFSGLAGIVTGAVKGAFNGMIGIINGAIGFINSTLIDNANKVPFVNIPHIPTLPKFHSGGMVTGGAEGTEVLGILKVGERVQTREMQAAESTGGNTYYITVNGLTELREFIEWTDELRNDGRGGGEVTE